jgi:hypothetical protein
VGFYSFNPAGAANQGQSQNAPQVAGLTTQPSGPAPAPAAAAPQVYKPPTLPYASNTPGFNGTGQTPQYGQQSPNFLGLGQYVAPLFPINDTAITGAPAQGAGQNYGLNSVWANLQKEIAAAGGQGGRMATATTGGPASYTAATGQAALAGGTNLGTGGNTINQQAQLAALLDAQARGGGAPSAADLQLKAGAEQNLAGQLAAMGSQRGVTNAALMNRNAANAAAASGANLNQQMGIQRAQESQAAQQAEGGVLAAQGGQAAGLNEEQANLAQQTGLANQAAQNAMLSGNLSAINAANLGNAQLGQQTNLANMGAENQIALANQGMTLSNAQLYDQELNAALGAQTGIGEADRAAALADQQLQLQQLIAANQVNEQAYQAAANANANLTGAVINGATTAGGQIIQHLGSGGGGGGNLISDQPAGSGQATGEPSTSSDGTYSGTLRNFNPNALRVYSDENLKTGIEGGNPMMRSFLENYHKSTAPKIDVTEGEKFRNPTYARAPGSSGGAGGGVGSAIGGLLGGIAGSFVAPGIGTAIGAGAGSQVGGAIGRGVSGGDGSGGGMVETSQGSGVTVDQSDMGEEDTSALSDENEKDAVTSGNRGMQEFLRQANAQTTAQNTQGATNNAFMQVNRPPNARVDTQLPGSPFDGFGTPTPSSGSPEAQQAGITNYGGYVPGGINTPFEPASQANQQALESAHQYAMPTPQSAVPVVDYRQPTQYQTAQAPFVGARPPMFAMSDERQKVVNTDGEPDPATDARFGELGMLKRPDGDVSTEISITVTDPRLNGGQPTNIPTLVKGQKNVDALLSGKDPTPQQQELAIRRAVQRQNGGAYLPGFKSIPEAVSAAEARSQTKGQMIAEGQDVLGSRPITAPTRAAQAPPFVPHGQQAGLAAESHALYDRMPEGKATTPTGPYAGLPYDFSGPPPSAAPQTFWDKASSYLSSLSDERQKEKLPSASNVQDMLDQLQAYKYRYKNPNAPGAAPGERLGVMAQDLEKSPLGKKFVKETPNGKMVDYGQMAGTQLAASAYLNDRLDQHERMLNHIISERS